MNVAIYGKKSDKIGRFFRNATGEVLPNGQVKIKTDRGSSVTVKTSYFGLVWTLENLEPTEFDENGIPSCFGKVSDIKPAPEIDGVFVGSAKDVNKLSVKKIREKYSLDDELKLQRLAIDKLLKAAKIKPNGWAEYNADVEKIIATGETCKKAHFKE